TLLTIYHRTTVSEKGTGQFTFVEPGKTTGVVKTKFQGVRIMKKALPIIIALVVIAIVFVGIGIVNKGKTTSQRRIAVIPKG
ncbi:unnamed protein product, partial [marine sediment metagenome]